MRPRRLRFLLKSSGKIQAKTPQEVKTTPSRNDLDLVEGLKRSGRALHAPKLPRSAGIPDSLTTCTDATRRLCALGLLAVRRRLRSRAPPEDYVKRAQPHQQRGADRDTRQLPLKQRYTGQKLKLWSDLVLPYVSVASKTTTDLYVVLRSISVLK